METNLKEKDIIAKLKELPLSYRQEILDFIDYLHLKMRKKETLYLSEKALSKEWLLPEEDEAWKDL